MDETKCTYVSSRGLLKSCDVTCEQLNSSTSELPDLSKMFDFCTLYICNSAIQNLAQNMDKIKHKFILVSGDSDDVNYEGIFESYDDFLKFVSNDYLIHWFCQNSAVKHNKISNLPIGLDYHSAGNGKTPIEQEEMLINIKNQSNPFDQRIHKCYINFKEAPDFYKYGYDRKDALEALPKNLCFTEHDVRDKCWKTQSEYAFVVSPFGNGLDPHRTWEALILGCIVIMKKYNDDFSNVYSDLPVFIVENWTDVTEELLEETIHTFRNKNFNYDKLKLKYWVDEINSYKNKKENFTDNSESYQNISIVFLLLFIFILCFLFLFLFLYLKKNITISITTFCIFLYLERVSHKS